MWISGAPALLDRVIDNLVGNAVKYTTPGDQIEVEVRRDHDRVILTVRDHGLGIPEDSIKRIFDRFYRVPGTGSSGAGSCSFTLPWSASRSHGLSPATR